MRKAMMRVHSPLIIGSLLLPDGALPSSFSRSSLLRRDTATSADTTQLTGKPDSAFEPPTLKLSEDSFQSYNCDLPIPEVQGQALGAYTVATLWNLRSSLPYTHSDKVPGLWVSGMGIIAAKQTVQYARNWAVDQGDGPLPLVCVLPPQWLLPMSNPGNTYRTREEVQRMRSTKDPIRSLQKHLEE
ncbi:hypothetical protein BKA70DRAFT_1437487 [Coprinopsis sp. MPI-PUGE-AT-0042]|nr:hypothetical protein BKA70DRAFT_1437487 [Coprinopsis sp. MPI-PUGE-AT-0042]